MHVPRLPVETKVEEPEIPEVTDEELQAYFVGLTNGHFAETFPSLLEYYETNIYDLSPEVLGACVLPFYSPNDAITDEMRFSVTQLMCNITRTVSAPILDLLVQIGFIECLCVLAPNYGILSLLKIIAGRSGAIDLSYPAEVFKMVPGRAAIKAISTAPFLSKLMELVSDPSCAREALELIALLRPDDTTTLAPVLAATSTLVCTTPDDVLRNAGLYCLHTITGYCDYRLLPIFFQCPDAGAFMARFSELHVNSQIELLRFIEAGFSNPEHAVVGDEVIRSPCSGVFSVISQDILFTLIHFLVVPLSSPEQQVVVYGCYALRRLISGHETVALALSLSIHMALFHLLEVANNYHSKKAIIAALCSLMGSAGLDEARVLLECNFMDMLSMYISSMATEIPHDIINALNQVVRHAEENNLADWFDLVFGDREITDALENMKLMGTCGREDEIQGIYVPDAADGLLVRQDNADVCFV